MKNKLWLFQLPVVLAFTLAYLITEQGLQGDLTHPFARQSLYPSLQRIASQFTDWKFKLRGPMPPKEKVVIVEIDSPSLETFGRWPWHRDIVAKLVDQTIAHGAKVVGLDMVLSEPDKRVPQELVSKLDELKLVGVASKFETDPVLTESVFKHSGKLVLGWTSEANCVPRAAYRGEIKDPAKIVADENGFVNRAEFDTELCPVAVDDPRVLATAPAGAAPVGFEKFAVSHLALPAAFDPWKVPVWTLLTFIPNLDDFNFVAEHAGYFNTFQDHDGITRRSALVMMHGRKAYPSLALEMARVGLGEQLRVELDERHDVVSLGFAKSGRKLAVSHLGAMDINFRGPAYSFPYVSALDVLSEKETLDDTLNRKLAGVRKSDVLKDAYVLIGLSALGANDMRAFPFDQNVAGVEGHASILDNILAGDMLVSDFSPAAWGFPAGTAGTARAMMLLLMVAGACLFAYAIQRLEAVPALLLFLLVFSGIGLADLKLLFARNVNWNTGFFYLEVFTIFVLTVAAKYVIEERSKKFVKGAFAKYVAPAVVDSILKHPEKLTVGGEKKDLTIMFSDIRSFTTFSEKLDAKVLASFLNEYLGIMTKIVFAHEGTLDKYIGDAIMAFWGAPLDQPKHSLNACKAAVAMMKALAENQRRWKEHYGVDVNIGVGINSGPVNVGNMGSSDNFSYTVIGDHVNLSSRLEGLTKAYGVAILTTRFTFDEIEKAGEKAPAHRVLDHVKVKGKKKAVELIQVLDRPMPDSGLALFAEGRSLYAAQSWDAAIAKFREASALLSVSPEDRDGPCDIFIGRCEDFKAAPPAPDWDGSWEMTSK